MSANKNVAWGKIEFSLYTDDDDFVKDTTTSLRQRTLSPRERILPPDSPTKKRRKDLQQNNYQRKLKNTPKNCELCPLRLIPTKLL